MVIGKDEESYFVKTMVISLSLNILAFMQISQKPFAPFIYQKRKKEKKEVNSHDEVLMINIREKDQLLSCMIGYFAMMYKRYEF